MDMTEKKCNEYLVIQLYLITLHYIDSQKAQDMVPEINFMLPLPIKTMRSNIPAIALVAAKPPPDN